MKLLFIASLKEYLPAVSRLVKQSGISVYSVSRTIGMRTADGESLMEDWFGSQGGEFDSVILFSFTDEASATRAITLVDAYNKTHDTGFPLRAFLLPVEKASQIT